eukprot:scaffold206491_cov44-Tisochrysis_lutea.AAC.1
MAVVEVKEAPRVNLSRSLEKGCGRNCTLLKLGKVVTPGQLSSLGVPSRANVRESWSSSPLPGSSGEPRTNSAKMQPSDQTSTAGPYIVAPRRSSGARYHSVTTGCVYALSGSPYMRASPKSAMHTRPRLLTKRLDVFRSR